MVINFPVCGQTALRVNIVGVGNGGMAVGVDLNVTHHRPARAGRVTGVATALHLGRRVTSYEVVISHESGVRVSTARVTCHVLRPGHDDPTPA